MKKAALMILVFAILPLSAGTQNGIIRFELTENHDAENPTTIKLNIPVAMLTAMGPQLEEAITEVRNQPEFSQFNEAWQEVRKIGPFQFAEINNAEAQINVYTDETHIVAEIWSQEEGNMKIRIPLFVGDIVFSQDQVVDYATLLEALETHRGEDLMTIEGEFVNARMWLD